MREIHDQITELSPRKIPIKDQTRLRSRRRHWRCTSRGCAQTAKRLPIVDLRSSDGRSGIGASLVPIGPDQTLKGRMSRVETFSTNACSLSSMLLSGRSAPISQSSWLPPGAASSAGRSVLNSRPAIVRRLTSPAKKSASGPTCLSRSDPGGPLVQRTG